MITLKQADALIDRLQRANESLVRRRSMLAALTRDPTLLRCELSVGCLPAVRVSEHHAHACLQAEVDELSGVVETVTNELAAAGITVTEED